MRAFFSAGGPARLTVATGLVACLAFAAFGESRDAVKETPTSETVAAAAAKRGSDAASRSLQRTTTKPKSATPAKPKAAKPAEKKQTTKPAAAKPAPAKKKAAAPAKARPVAGLSQVQMDNAHAIVKAGQALGMPKRGLVVAIATAMQESQLLNLANPYHQESMNLPNQGVGFDHDSVGLFQQRPESGWGTPRELMNPKVAASRFYNALAQVPGWQHMAVTDAAQAVQVSAYPYAYAKHEGRAAAVVNALAK